MDKYIFIFFNILIAGALISYNSGILQKTQSNIIINTISQSNIYKWSVLIIHFFAYLFIINLSFSKLDHLSGDIPKRIKDIRNQYLNSFPSLLLFTFNLSSFNYIFPAGFILEIIIVALLLYCIYTNKDKKGFVFFLTCIKSVIKNVFQILTLKRFGWLIKLILMFIILCYFLHFLCLFGKAECKTNEDTETSTYCIIMKWSIFSLNSIISCLLVAYLALNESVNPCKQLFGLNLKNKSIFNNIDKATRKRLDYLNLTS